MLSKPVEPCPDNLPGFKALSANDGIIHRCSIARHFSFFSGESIRDFYFLVLVYRTIEWQRNLLAVPINYFLFWFFMLVLWNFLDTIRNGDVDDINYSEFTALVKNGQIRSYPTDPLIFSGNGNQVEGKYLEM